MDKQNSNVKEIQTLKANTQSNYGICFSWNVERFVLWNAGYRHFMADKVLGLAFPIGMRI
jgi:hypothetical protein